MAIDWADSTSVTNGGSGTTSIVLSRPTNIADGDALLALLSWTSGTVTVSSTPPGFTLIRTTSSGGSNQITAASYYKIAASETAGVTYTFGLTGTGIQNNGIMWQVTGAHATTPFDSSNGATGQGKVPTVGSTTQNYNDEMIVLFIGYGSNQASFTFTIPAAYQTHNLVTGGGSSRIIAAEYENPGAGSTGSISCSANAALSTDWWAIQTIIMRPPDVVAQDFQLGQCRFPDVMEHYDDEGLEWPYSGFGFMCEDSTPTVLIDIVPYCMTDVPEEFYEEPWETLFPALMSNQPLSPNAPTPTPTPSVASNLITPRVSLIPGSVTDDAQWKRQAATWMQEANKGHLQNTGIVTLTPGQSSTVVSDDRAGPNSFIDFMPRTANAATEKGNGTLYIQSQGKKTFTIAHANNAQSDRTYIYTILG